MANNNPAHIVLTNVRLSYVHLDKPYANPNNNGEPKYQATILVPKSDLAGRQKIDAAIAAATAYAREKMGNIFPVHPKNSVHDGDGVRPSDGQPFGDECKGHWVFTASNKLQPDCRDQYKQPLLDASELYSGVYAHVGVTFFGYNAGANKGIGVALDTVMKARDGEVLGGVRANADDDFADIPAAAGDPAPAQTNTWLPQNDPWVPGIPKSTASEPAPWNPANPRRTCSKEAPALMAAAAAATALRTL